MAAIRVPVCCWSSGDLGAPLLLVLVVLLHSSLVLRSSRSPLGLLDSLWILFRTNQSPQRYSGAFLTSTESDNVLGVSVETAAALIWGMLWFPWKPFQMYTPSSHQGQTEVSWLFTPWMHVYLTRTQGPSVCVCVCVYVCVCVCLLNISRAVHPTSPSASWVQHELRVFWRKQRRILINCE